MKYSPDRLEVHLEHVRLPAGNGKAAEKTKGSSLDVMSAIKKSIVTVTAAINCLAHALLSLLPGQMETLNTNHIGTVEASKNLLRIF